MIKVTEIKIANFLKLFAPTENHSTFIQENRQSLDRLRRKLDAAHEEVQVEVIQLHDRKPVDGVNEHRDDFT
jgi:hypothetical protein